MTVTLRPHDLLWLSAPDALEGKRTGSLRSGTPGYRLLCGVMLMRVDEFPLACVACAAISARGGMGEAGTG